MSVYKPAYVVGFYFVPGDQVVLIRKNKPEFQRGKLNGVGGVAEPGEYSHEAMVREFREETGKSTTVSDWRFFARLALKECVIDFFSAHGDCLGISTTTDEIIEIVDVRRKRDVLPNLRWLIPLALNNEPTVIITQ